jgi:hypothetical protein
MTGALFYELLDGPVLERRRCFAKLPAVENPVVLVDHVSGLMRSESREQRPCGKPSEHAIKGRFRFNSALLEDDYVLPDEARQAMLDEALSLEQERLRLVDISDSAKSLFEGLLQGTDAERKKAKEDALAQIAEIHWVLGFYRQLESTDPSAPFPDAAIVGPSWAHFRWLQVQLLYTLDLYVRYQGQVREMLTGAVPTRLENDLHDAQGLALGVLEGALATREKELATWFRLLRPDGELIQ